MAMALVLATGRVKARVRDRIGMFMALVTDMAELWGRILILELDSWMG